MHQPRVLCTWGCGHDGRLGTGAEHNVPAAAPVDVISRAIFGQKGAVASVDAPGSAIAAAAAAGTSTSSVRNAFGIAVPAAAAAAACAAAAPPPASQQQQQQQEFLSLKVNRVFCGGYHTFVEVIHDADGSSPSSSRPCSRPGSAGASSTTTTTATTSEINTNNFHFASRTHHHHHHQQQQLRPRNPSSNAILLSFGDNEYGQLGLGDKSLRTGPQIVEPFFTLAAATSAGGSEIVFVSKADGEKFGNSLRATTAATTTTVAAAAPESTADFEDKWDGNLDDRWKQTDGRQQGNNNNNNSVSAKDSTRNRIHQILDNSRLSKKSSSCDFDIKSNPYLWYRHEDLIDIRCGRQHCIAWFRPSARHPAGRLFVCGRNDSGQLGMMDTDTRSSFVEMLAPLEMLLQSATASAAEMTVTLSTTTAAATSMSGNRVGTVTTTTATTTTCILDVSCGSNHSMLLLGPLEAAVAGAPCSRSSWTCQFHNNAGTLNSGAWVREKLTQLFDKVASSSSSSSLNSTQQDQSNNNNNTIDNYSDAAQRAAVLASFSSLFSVWSCGRGDLGELGVDGDEKDARSDAEQRIKSAVERQHQRKKYREEEGRNGAAAAAAGAPVMLRQQQQQQHEANAAADLNDDDSAITGVLDPSAAKKLGGVNSLWKNSSNGAQQQDQGAQQQCYRVAMNRPQWTSVDLSTERCKLLEPATVIVPLSLAASHGRSAVYCGVFSPASSSSSSSSSAAAPYRQTWLSFGAFYHNLRETIESSIPTETALPPETETAAATAVLPVAGVVGIESAELCWSSHSLFIRGGPCVNAIRDGGESREWQRVSLFGDDDGDVADVSSTKRILHVVPQGKGALIACETTKAQQEGKEEATKQEQQQQQQQVFSCCCAKTIELYALGDNYFGQLGVGDDEDRGGDAEKKQCASIMMLMHSRKKNHQQQQQQESSALRILCLGSGAHHAALVLRK